MTRKTGRDVVHRYEDNPLIGIEDMPFRCGDIWNAGVIRFEGEYLLLLTVETLEGLGNVYAARGKDGRHFSIESKPLLSTCTREACGCYTTFGICDPRITEIDGVYYITFVANSESGKRIGLARTKDFKSVE
ncbi:MAG: glycosidase, partial [Planctomycetes bacterium]|nr:glycosidase [Planctomycetota bacterium]